MDDVSGASGSDSHAESMAETEMETPPDHEREKPRGRPVGKPDSTKRYRRTAQEISDGKIKVIQMRLDAMKESEALKLANKKSRRPNNILTEEPLASSSLREGLETTPKKVPLPSHRPHTAHHRDDSSPSPRRTTQFRRQSFYDSWFPSSPRTMR